MSAPALFAGQSTLPSSSRAVTPAKMHEREQIRMRDVWDKAIQNDTKYVRYKETIVLMLSWKDSDLNKSELNQEVADLADVFQDCYGFKVFRHVLDSKDNPRRRLNKYLSNFVDEYDNDETLLILYYAGHGWDTQNLPQRKQKILPPEFMLADKATVEAAQMEKALVAWRSAEYILFQADNADILAIFDCCEAGSLASARRPLRFEYLGACLRGDSTKPAGKESFTRALIWALKELKDEKGSWYNTTRLLHKIKDAPNFPVDQTPALGARVIQDDYIVISPAPHKLTSSARKMRETQLQERKRTSEFLDLRFRFDHILDDRAVQSTAQALRRLMGENKIQATEITFLEKHARFNSRLSHLVRKVMHYHSEGQLNILNEHSLEYAPLLEAPEGPDTLMTPLLTDGATPEHGANSDAEGQPPYTNRKKSITEPVQVSDLTTPRPKTPPPTGKRKLESEESPRRQSSRVKKQKVDI